MVRFMFRALLGQPFASGPTVCAAQGDGTGLISASELFLRICDQAPLMPTKGLRPVCIVGEQFNLTWINLSFESLVWLQP